jgi:hypothetical protein
MRAIASEFSAVRHSGAPCRAHQKQGRSKLRPLLNSQRSVLFRHSLFKHAIHLLASRIDTGLPRVRVGASSRHRASQATCSEVAFDPYQPPEQQGAEFLVSALEERERLVRCLPIANTRRCGRYVLSNATTTNGVAIDRARSRPTRLYRWRTSPPFGRQTPVPLPLH